MAKDHPTGKSGLYAAFLELETPEECYRFLQDVCSYAELSAMEQRYNIAEKLMRKQSYTSIMGNIGASSAIISRVSRVLGRDIVLSCERLARGEGKGRVWCTVHAKALPVQQFFKALRYRNLKPAEQDTGTVPRDEVVFEHTLG